MDLTQKKLSKSEWLSIETPVDEYEKKVLKVIIDGYTDVNIRYNDKETLRSITKISILDATEVDAYFYNKYFAKDIEERLSKLQKLKDKQAKQTRQKVGSIDIIDSVIELLTTWITESSPRNMLKKLKKADIIRINHTENIVASYMNNIYEFVVFEFCNKILDSTIGETNEYILYTYTLIQFQKLSILNVNGYIKKYSEYIVRFASNKINIPDIYYNSINIIEKNKHLLEYADMTLYNHQKELFSILKDQSENPCLLLYTAPTGTGKTLSPIGIASKYRVIFVCVARHVGLALAKSAITMGKKVAFAFGCETASDIRLHYFAAVAYSINTKSGGINRVDNSVGTNVEIMICDVMSYVTAMHYMLAFNNKDNIVTYWDEPTITMDYENHDLHPIIHRNWVENRIPKVILSCATLPREEDIMETIVDFSARFDGALIYTISSHDFKKTISALNKDGKCVLPHLLYPNYKDMTESVAYCKNNKTLLRYFDLEEILRCIEYIESHKYISDAYMVENSFTNISDITLDQIKTHYLEVLSRISAANWPIIYNYLSSTQTAKFSANKPAISPIMRKIQSIDSSIAGGGSSNTSVFTRTMSTGAEPPANPAKGILLTTADAYTLTDGPTIFLAEDVDKIAKFYIQSSKIPEEVYTGIMHKLEENDSISKKIAVLEKTLEDAVKDDIEKEKKMNRDHFNNDTRNTLNQINGLVSSMQSVNMDSRYIPNMKQHQMIWAPNGKEVHNAFVPRVDEATIKDIMTIDIPTHMKMLLLLGIGVFTNEPNIKYMEVMKKLAIEQRLYIIIAQSDYIYGTNYQFCHGFIGKDLLNMTQQKIIQAMGRIGRNNIQQEYTVRFRDDALLQKLFRPTEENMEAINMSRLFSSDE